MLKRLRVEHLERCIGCYQCVLACARVTEKVLSVDRASIKVQASGGYGGPFAVVVCRGCLDPPCVPACPVDGAIRPRPKNGGGVIITRKCDATQCNQECVDACTIPGAIFIEPDLQKAIVCKQCSACVDYCPTGVLTMEEPKPGF